MNRRTVLKGAAATAALIPLAGVVSACAGAGGGTTTSSAGSSAPSSSAGGGSSSAPSAGAGSSSAPSAAAGSSDNPFNVKKGSTIDAVIFNGGFGYDYVTFAAKEVDAKWGTTTTVTPQTNIAQVLQPQFAAGNPPDLIDNSGANLIGFDKIKDDLSTMDDLLAANNYEGKNIGESLANQANIKTQGMVDGKFKVLNYAVYNYGWWYSASLFKKNNWTPPSTYDEALALGEQAKKAGKYLLVFGKEAATYYLISMITSATKDGGAEVTQDLQNLKANAWSNPALQTVFGKMKQIVDNGYFVPGGAGTQFTAAQAEWSNSGKALLYASGGWIESEMKNATASGFDMAVVPDPSGSGKPSMPMTTIRSYAQEGYIQPSTSKNPAGGKELLRAMLSKDAALNFSKTRMCPTIVAGVVPADAFGFTGLASQLKMQEAAGDNVTYTTFINQYGLNTAQLVTMNSFLSGQLSVKDMTSQLQAISDKAAGQ